MMTREEKDFEVSGLSDLFGAKPPAEQGLVRELGLRALVSKVLGQVASTLELGPYRVEAKVGEGGMGVVYRGYEAASGRVVAIKMLAGSQPKLRQRFQREASLLRELRHPRIVRYLDHGTSDDDQDYLVMEWLDGEDLATRLGNGPLSVPQALRLARIVALGLSSAHGAGIVHRDIKPRNLFLVEREIDLMKVIDFGVAAHVGAGDGLTSTGNWLGTPAYMAPEQLRGKSDVRTDVYGLGATLFECLTGRPPFVAEHAGALLLAVATEPPPHLGSLCADVPPELELLVQRMLAKDSAARPISMNAVLTELSVIMDAPVPPGARTVLSLAERAVTRDAHPASAPPATEIRGRVRELATLTGAAHEVLMEDVSGACVISGEPGIGKTRLLEAFLAESERAGCRVLHVTCQPDETGLPFAALLGLLASLERDSRGDPTLAAAVRRVEGQLGPLAAGERAAGVASSADEVRLAWLDLVESMTSRGPVILALDGVESVDLASFRHVESAARLLRPLLVVLAGREGQSLELLSTAWRGPSPTTLRLGALGARSLERLARASAPALKDGEVARLIQASAGNPGHLLALVRASEHGRVAVGSLSRLAFERVSTLDDESRRLLRGAAIMGLRFWVTPLSRMMGCDETTIGALLSRLAQLGFVAPLEPRHEGAFGFCQELERVTLLELCTEADLRLAHRITGQWLAETRRGLPLQVARHLRAGGELEQAAHHYLRAARAAASAEDASELSRVVDEAIACQPSERVVAQLAATSAEGALWRGALAEASTACERALQTLRKGSTDWYRALSLLVTSLGQAGRNADVTANAGLILDSTADVEAKDAQLACAGRLLSQIAAVDPQLGRRLAVRVEALAASHCCGPEAKAWLERGRAWLAMGRDFDGTTRAWGAAHAYHTAAHDPRSAAQVQIYLGSLYTWSGAWERARIAISDAFRATERLGSAYLQVWARYTEGKLLTETAAFEVTKGALNYVIERTADSPRMRNGARVYLAMAALRAGELAQAVDSAEACLSAGGALVPQLGARAILVLAALDAGDLMRACSNARELQTDYAKQGRLVEFDALVQLALASAAYAEGSSAKDATLGALAALEADAATIADPLTRSHFWERPFVHQRLHALSGAARTPLV